MKYVVAVGLWMVALGACQVAAIPHEVGGRGKVSASELLGPGTLTVMTRSLELGTSLERVLETRSAADVPERTAKAFARLGREELTRKTRRLADEVQYARPHLLGLQKVSRIHLQSPGDAIFGGSQPAEAVYLDLLPELLGELAARGLHYREVARVRNADAELPMRTSAAPTFDDVRFTDFDIILARADVTVSEAAARNYLAHREVAVPGLEPVALRRGWASVAATVQGRTYRFVSTHLEPAPNEARLRVQLAQAEELIAALRGDALPVVLVGDFNTPANLGLVGAPTYRELLMAGYVDVWTRRMGTVDVPGLMERLNLILVRHSVAPLPRRFGPVLAYAVRAPEETWTGPWSPGLAGVVARLRVPAPLARD